MESTNQCHCCLQRPLAKDLRTPYTHLGITEIYSDMIEECFVIKLTSSNDGKSGICEVCLGRLREACLFKMQVQQCQAELLERLEGGLSVKDEEALDQPPEDAYSEPSEPSSSAFGATAEPLSERARQQLALACSVRLERLRDQPRPVTSHRRPSPVTSHRRPSPVTSHRRPSPVTSHRRPSPVTSHRRPSPAGSEHDLPGDAAAEQQAYTHDTSPTHTPHNSSLITHQQHQIPPQTNQTTYCCDMCSQQFTSKLILIGHIRTHTLLEPHPCGVCKETFANRLILNKHLRFHSLERPYVCEVCNKRFARKPTLKNHRTTHMTVKPYKCKECNKQFARKGCLDVHERTHSGVKPYKCKKCNKQFTRKSVFSDPWKNSQWSETIQMYRMQQEICSSG
ncbi:zinc finger protein 26-like [Cydia pomonella]|uniref:zinc finger protein 26-like n=1 Tax=Cydia pomonella TaxID=82600 RepID=UPI002ADD9A71|nr:zinc finger protein 26-like [Cydia pomonella]